MRSILRRRADGPVGKAKAQMQARDGFKEELGWLKVLIVLVATLDASLVNWLVHNPTQNRVLLGVSVWLVMLGIVWGVSMLRRGWALIALLKQELS